MSCCRRVVGLLSAIGDPLRSFALAPTLHRAQPPVARRRIDGRAKPKIGGEVVSGPGHVGPVPLHLCIYPSVNFTNEHPRGDLALGKPSTCRDLELSLIHISEPTRLLSTS